MAGMAHVVVPNYPHHVTQRGNRRQKTFFCEDDYRYYIDLMSEFSRQSGTEVWAYCLMPNHIHLVMAPGEEKRTDSCSVFFRPCRTPVFNPASNGVVDLFDKSRIIG